MTPDLEGDPSRGDGGGHDDAAAEPWTPAERALLDAALEFYGAAESVIDYADREQPRVRHDAAGLEAVRRTMGALEACVRTAHANGVAQARIAEITRIEPDIVALILQRGGDGGAPSPPES